MSTVDANRTAAPQPLAAAERAQPRTTRAQLRKLAHELEGVFVAQLFQAMRRTAPGGGILEPTPGEETFTGMLDDMMARRAAEQSTHGIGEALYRQLARRLPAEAAGEKP
jgi:Rod binding domain-containing protein